MGCFRASFSLAIVLVLASQASSFPHLLSSSFSENRGSVLTEVSESWFPKFTDRIFATNWDSASAVRRVAPLWTNREGVRDRLLRLAEVYAGMNHVPYVWGGSSIGTQEQCLACRSCISKKKLGKFGRQRLCPACRQCGVDCSHFVQILFSEAGLNFPYASTGLLRAMSAKQLREKYGLIDIGTDLNKAQTGDLLLHPRHITMLLNYRDHGYGDFIHASMFGTDDRAGRIEVAQDFYLRRFRGRLLRILRHKDAVLDVELTRPRLLSSLLEADRDSKAEDASDEPSS